MRDADALRFDAVLFDLDGTLLDTLPDLVEVTNTTLAERGFPRRTPEEIHGFVGDGATVLIRRSLPAGTPEDVVEETVGRWRELYPRIGLRLTRPYPHMEETLRELRARGLRLGVVSNKYDGGVHDVMGRYLPGLFDVMHGEGPGFPRKPDPTGLLRAIDELGCVPARAMYVGDACSDMATAAAAGAFAVGAAWGYSGRGLLEGAPCDVVLDDPSQILGLLGPA